MKDSRSYRPIMGFKAKARKHKGDSGKNPKDNKKTTVTEGQISCGIKSCDGYADKSMGGRSLSIDNAIDVWGSGGYEERKGRVRVCKSCYRKWKKDNKSEDTY